MNDLARIPADPNITKIPSIIKILDGFISLCERNSSFLDLGDEKADFVEAGKTDFELVLAFPKRFIETIVGFGTKVSSPAGVI